MIVADIGSVSSEPVARTAPVIVVYTVVPRLAGMAGAVLPQTLAPSSSNTDSDDEVAVAAADIVAVVLLVTAAIVVPAGTPLARMTSPTSPGLKLAAGSVRVEDALAILASGMVRLIGNIGLTVTRVLAAEAVAAFDSVTVVPLTAVMVVPFGMPAP